MSIFWSVMCYAEQGKISMALRVSLRTFFLFFCSVQITFRTYLDPPMLCNCYEMTDMEEPVSRQVLR